MSQNGIELDIDDPATATARTRPLMLGYVRRHLLMTDAELVAVRQRITQFAFEEGFALGTVYIEEVETVPAAFEALVAAASDDEVSAVVVPTLLHLAVLGAPRDLKMHFEYCTGTRVLVATS